MRKGWFVHELDLTDQDTGIRLAAKIRVSYVYYPRQDAPCEAGGPPIDPDEPARVEIDKVTLESETGAWAYNLKPGHYDQADIERRCMEDAES